MISLKNKVALVTGGSRGIGRGITIKLAEAGADVAINFFSDEKAAAATVKAANKYNVKVEQYRADISKENEVEEIIETVKDKFGKIDILVNNAGIWKYAKIHEMTEAQWDETININLKGIFTCCKHVSKIMIDQKYGKIINISSTAGQRGEADHSHYAASKGAIISFTKSLAPELAPYNITVNCVAPGWIHSDMTQPVIDDKEYYERVLNTIPMRRFGEPEEIAGAVLFLASELGNYVTGEIVNVNGGSVLCG